MFAGTFAVQGDATGTVTAIGAATRLAGIAALTDTAERPSSPLAVQLHRLVLVVAGIAVAVGALLAGVSMLAGDRDRAPRCCSGWASWSRSCPRGCCRR